MGQCACHPGIETRFLCMKHNLYLCEECLKCQDPELYCKFRSSCPIWFLEKKGGKELLGEATAAAEGLPTRQVTFLPDNTTVSVPGGTTLLEAAQQADVYINASCNGKGACGKCKLIIEFGETDSRPSPLLTDQERQKNYVLACRTRISSDVSVRIPVEAVEKKLKVVDMAKEATEQLRRTVGEITPMLTEIPLDLDPPTLEGSVSDLDRISRGLNKNSCDIERMKVGLKVMLELAGYRLHNSPQMLE
jgi:ferredoxin